MHAGSADRVPRPDDGVATVWGMAWIAACSMIGWLAVMATVIVSAQHRLDGAADLAAVSGAARLQRGGDACVVAADIAHANDAALTACRVDGSDLVVTVSHSVALPLGLDGAMTSTARAGP